MVTATVDLDEVVSYRGAVSSLQEQASAAARVPTVTVDFDLCHPQSEGVVPDPPMQPRYHDPEEEVALGETQVGIIVWPCYCVHAGADKHTYSTNRPGMLAVGLPEAVGGVRLPAAPQRRCGQLRGGGHRGQHVPASGGSREGA